jgi:1-acyl-sn-glycerol-3-phosphate acyltransferase
MTPNDDEDAGTVDKDDGGGFLRVRRASRGPWFGLAVLLLRPTLMLLTHRDWRGQERLPRTGGVVVCVNHISYFDPLTCAHFVYDAGRCPRFLAKASVFRIPVAGRIIRGAGQIPVFRDTGEAGLAFTAAVDATSRGECVVIYPEATITQDPDLWPMTGKTGAARVALRTGAPVIPVAQWGPQDVLAPYARWPRLLPRKTIHVAAGPPVDLSEFAGRELTPQVLQAATTRILDAITAALESIRGEAAPAVRFDSRAAGLSASGNPTRPARSRGSDADRRTA